MKLQLSNLNHQAMFNLQNKKQKGFTLVESAIAIVVLLIGLLAVIQFFPFGIEIIGNANNRTIASNLALSKIEEIRSETYDDISTGTLETKSRMSSDPDSYLYDFQRETIVEFVDSDFNTSVSDVGLKKITVNVYWQSAIINSEKSININSVVADF